MMMMMVLLALEAIKYCCVERTWDLEGLLHRHLT